MSLRLYRSVSVRLRTRRESPSLHTPISCSAKQNAHTTPAVTMRSAAASAPFPQLEVIPE